MKSPAIIAISTLLTVAVPAVVQAAEMKDPHAGHQMPADAKAETRTYKASGVVKKVDAAKGSVTLAHGPVAELKWPAMTMGFTVKDKALLGKLAVDKKIDFEFIEQGKSYVITAVK